MSIRYKYSLKIPMFVNIISDTHFMTMQLHTHTRRWRMSHRNFRNILVAGKLQMSENACKTNKNK